MSGAGHPPVDLGLLNPNRYPEASARRLRPWVEAVLAELAPAGESFAVRFCGDREMRRVNFQFRGKDKPTDVLSFPGDDAENAGHANNTDPAAETGESSGHLGDVLISVPTARRQAVERGEEAERELKVLILHGLLHCLGHDHETDDGEMEALERKLRRRFLRAGFPPAAPRSQNA